MSASRLLIGGGWTMNELPPGVDQFIHDYLTQLRAPLKRSTMFGPAGRQVLRSPGERVILAPNGEPIRIIENPDGNLIETENSLHSHVRPASVSLKSWG